MHFISHYFDNGFYQIVAQPDVFLARRNNTKYKASHKFLNYMKYK
jgi:hypothetical protein